MNIIKQSLTGLLILLVFFIFATIIAIIEQQPFFIIMHSLGIFSSLTSSVFIYKKYKKLQ
ncbi:hypothetical protein [Lysinibacillus sphaericus]|uniref:hypothetical protein n=1 Tax=Lysinibacillus sphaericus TaxID=1421 RepID=UPI000C196231|nr:hypothetical protein [Lysinibacillus sphaericus]PIJ98649.1 hypothetical protein CTN02_08215 [Lysinibacillus sphaericus]